MNLLSSYTVIAIELAVKNPICLRASARRKRLITEAPVLVENHDRLHLDEVLGNERRADADTSQARRLRRSTAERAARTRRRRRGS